MCMHSFHQYQHRLNFGGILFQVTQTLTCSWTHRILICCEWSFLSRRRRTLTTVSIRTEWPAWHVLETGDTFTYR